MSEAASEIVQSPAEGETSTLRLPAGYAWERLEDPTRVV